MAGDDLYQYFKIEAREIVADLGRDVINLEKTGADTGLLPRVLRQIHTLKGAARVVRLPRIAEIAHAMEDALTPHRGASDRPTTAEIGHLLEQVDLISSEIAALDPVAADAPAPLAASTPLERVRVDLAEMDALLSGISETAVQLDGIRHGIEAIKQIEQRLAGLAAQLNPAAGAAPPWRETVEELRGELQHARQGLVLRTDTTEREVAAVRGNIDRLRLLPTTLLFPSLERAARDAAETLGKQVVWQTSGREQRLESHVLSAIGEALSHLVRNAVAHGIEQPEVRRTHGKPPSGEVHVSIVRHADRIMFTCSDDGRGIDVDAVRRAAVSIGALSAAGASELSTAHASELIFSPGVTTSASLNQVAGRGIGLDAVRETAQRFKGRVAVRTEPGRGTSIDLEIPVSLSSVRAILLGVGDLLVWVPLDAVQCMLRLDRDALTSLAGRESLIFGGRAIPFVRLAETMGRPPQADLDSRPRLAAIVQTGADLMALSVDRAIHVKEVIVHPLPEIISRVNLLAGAVFDAEGNPQLVLDPEAVLEAARAAPVEQTLKARPHILVIDDSLTSRVMVQNILEAGGYRIDLAISGEDAMTKARGCRYNLFVCDVEMPGMDGFEFVSRTRDYDHLRGIPSILITTRGGAEDRRRGAAVGARAYIVKGEFSKDSLIETVRTLVG